FYLNDLIDCLRLNFDRLAFRGAESVHGIALHINNHMLDLNSAAVNDWLDTLELPIAGVLQQGKNTIYLSIQNAAADLPPLSEPLYLRGKFCVTDKAQGA